MKLTPVKVNDGVSFILNGTEKTCSTTGLGFNFEDAWRSAKAIAVHCRAKAVHAPLQEYVR